MTGKIAIPLTGLNQNTTVWDTGHAPPEGLNRGPRWPLPDKLESGRHKRLEKGRAFGKSLLPKDLAMKRRTGAWINRAQGASGGEVRNAEMLGSVSKRAACPAFHPQRRPTGHQVARSGAKSVS